MFAHAAAVGKECGYVGKWKPNQAVQGKKMFSRYDILCEELTPINPRRISRLINIMYLHHMRVSYPVFRLNIYAYTEMHNIYAQLTCSTVLCISFWLFITIY